MRVFTRDKSQEITPSAQADGFYRINKIPGTDIYRIEGVFSAVLTPAAHCRMPRLLIRSIASRRIEIVLQDPEPVPLTAEVFDVRGRLVQDMKFSKGNRSSRPGVVSKQLTRGIYLVKCASGNNMLTKKIVLAE
jgi:hypothetical protein